jgi:hypothetical protein
MQPRVKDPTLWRFKNIEWARIDAEVGQVNEAAESNWLHVGSAKAGPKVAAILIGDRIVPSSYATCKGVPRRHTTWTPSAHALAGRQSHASSLGCLPSLSPGFAERLQITFR